MAGVIPSETTTQFWIFVGRSKSNRIVDGKWMLFFPKTDLDAKWQRLQELYHGGELMGVECMKVSTQKLNPRASNTKDGVVILYCSNSADEDHIISTGNRIQKAIAYDNDMYYKTDIQTLKGTHATGSRNNYTYKISRQKQITKKLPEQYTAMIVPFGKYKGETISSLLTDSQYLDWCKNQPWFKTKYEEIYNVVSQLIKN